MNSLVLGLNTSATWYPASSYDQYGQTVLALSIPIKCAIISMADIVKASPTRSQLSASQGRVDENQGDAKILVNASTNINVGDKIVITSSSYISIGSTPRYDNWGFLNHFEIALKAVY